MGEGLLTSILRWLRGYLSTQSRFYQHRQKHTFCHLWHTQHNKQNPCDLEVRDMLAAETLMNGSSR